MDKQALKTMKTCRKFTFLLSSLGFALAYYSVFVSAAKTRDPTYQALCDISETMRCSKVFTSSFGRGLGIVNQIFGDDSPLYQANGVYGMVMYSLFVLLSLFPYQVFAKGAVLLGVVANIVSAYLGYVLLFIIKDVCVVCITTYAIGFLLLIVAFKNLSAVKKLRGETSANVSSYLDGRNTPGKKRV